MKGMKPSVTYVYVTLSYRAFHIAARFWTDWLLYARNERPVPRAYVCIVKYVL